MLPKLGYEHKVRVCQESIERKERKEHAIDSPDQTLIPNNVCPGYKKILIQSFGFCIRIIVTL